MAENKSAKKTLLMSVIMSSPGPLVVGLGLLVGKSSTQIADFVRRSIELLAIILSFVVYCLTTKGDSVDELKKKRRRRKNYIEGNLDIFLPVIFNYNFYIKYL